MPALVCAIAGIAACGSSSGPPERGLVVTGSGVRAAQPPWSPEYQHLAARLRKLGLPPTGDEKFHIHALLSIYVNGLLVPVAAEIGLDPARHVESSLHTHDESGVIHMEAAHAFAFTLGDFFDVWGVRFGAGTLGSLQDNGSSRVWVYVNGKPITDPARLVLRNGDDIAVGYGGRDSFPHQPSTFALRKVEQGSGALACSAGNGRKRQTSCLAPGAGKGK